MDRARDIQDNTTAAPMTVRDQQLSPETILRILWRRKWRILLPALVIASSAAWWIHRLPDRYRSDAVLLVIPQRVPETFVRSTVTTRTSDRLQSVTQQILSRTQLEQIIRDFNLYNDQRTTESMQDIVETMRTRDIDIRPIKGDAFRLGFVADRPEVAKQVAERLVSLFIVQTSADRASLAQGTDEFLDEQLEDARRRLVENELKLSEYRRLHNGALPAQLEANVRGLHNTEVQLQLATDSLNRDRERQLLLERSLQDANLEALTTRAVAAPADPSQRSATEQLELAETVLRNMQSTLTDQHPDIVAQKQAIADLRRRSEAEGASRLEADNAGAADKIRSSRLETLRLELSALEEQIAQKTADRERLRAALLDYQKRIEAAPAREAELAPLTRDYETLQQTYRGLLAKKQESRIAANLEREQSGAHFKVLDPARLPEQPFTPNRTLLYAIGVFVAFVVGLTFAIASEWFERGLRTQDEVRAALGLPVLAAIPLVPMRSRSRRRTAAMALVGTGVCACGHAIACGLLA